MNTRIIETLRTIHNITGVRFAALALLLAAFSGTAMGQCGDSLKALSAAAASVRSHSKSLPFGPQASVENQSAAGGDNSVNTSIVGLWYIRFLVGGEQIQEAFQIWNDGGTEVHNPNVNPGGLVCLGTWTEGAPQTFNLTHRVWNYDGGVFRGTIHLSETLVLGNRGNTHSGTFKLGFYDPSGNFLFEVPGSVVGERIAPN